MTSPLIRALAAPLLAASLSSGANAQSVTADFARWTGPPLIKTKMAVYQAPFLGEGNKPPLTAMRPFLAEAGVQDLRYEMAWGKPDAYAFDQISGPPDDPRIDFRPLDPFVNVLRNAGITPLFALGYDPLPLKKGADWQRWKDVPSGPGGSADLNTWQRIVRDYSAHYRALDGLHAPFYEIWNEPDLPGDGGKVFFNGSPSEYASLFQAGVRGVRDGDPDAPVGGPAIAYDLAYAQAILSDPGDFVSIHAYRNFPGQIRNMRGLVRQRPNVPILLTEYASFDSFGSEAPISRHDGAVRFFEDAQGLLAYQDVPKVYWAQWIDNDLGMLTYDLHRKAIFNAYKMYQTMLPVDRNPVVIEDGGRGDSHVDAMASSDDHTAAVVVWNSGPADRTVTVRLKDIPFRSGTASLCRIDSLHGSYVDTPASESLAIDRQWRVSGGGTEWTGVIPSGGIALLRAADDTGENLLRPHAPGAYVRSYYWFPDRTADSWADFDPHTGIARVGAGSGDHDPVQIGAVIDRPAAHWRVAVRRQGPFAPEGPESLFGLRVDYGSRSGGYRRSVMWHDGSYSPARTTALPWGTGRSTVDRAFERDEMRSGAPFRLDVAAEAPSDWNGRIVLTPILQQMGAGCIARIIMTEVGK